jgi:hypothetical protein
MVDALLEAGHRVGEVVGHVHILPYRERVSGGEFYWCLDHNRVEGADSPCPPDRRMGPYESQDAAEQWNERVESRNEQWDAEDKAWEEGE